MLNRILKLLVIFSRVVVEHLSHRLMQDLIHSPKRRGRNLEPNDCRVALLRFLFRYLSSMWEAVLG